MPKLPALNGKYIPQDVEFQNSGKEMVPNSDFPENERVKVQMTYADIAQKDLYMQSYGQATNDKSGEIKVKTDKNYNLALETHIIKIENLYRENNVKIITGKDLVSCKHPGLNDLKQDLFARICGVRYDDNPDDGPGELNQEEKKASV